MLPVEARKADFRLCEVGKDITKATTIVVKSLTVLDKVAHDEDHPVVAHEMAMLNGALALLDKAPMTGLLFGDGMNFLKLTGKLKRQRG
ncbi:hypothetical protein E2C01_048899 [Portunus trituberculatus]|uniref:Uncharacterized protein n=1 Tax=Portunus trituberculatus TaxID=210409 RepID=A0A5B7GBE0_PORTR|nr:hypothetical protein [Portunus trituberculatus]